MRTIAIDFETANEQRTSACAVGLAWIEDGTVSRTAYRLIRPAEMRFAPGNVRVHGIRPEDVAGAGCFVTVMEEFLPELAGALVLAHNAAFDISVLRGTLAARGETVPRLAYLCTRAVGRHAWPNAPSCGLAALARRIGLSFRHHHAEDDAVACARVALAAGETVGTSCLQTLALRLGIRPGSLDGPEHQPCLSTRPRRRGDEIRVRRLAAGAPSQLDFAVAGSRGDRYDIRGAFTRRGGYELRCSCLAGRNRLRCRHVTALLDGEITNLLSDPFAVEKLRTIVEALGPEAVEPAAGRRGPPRAVQPAISAPASAASATLPGTGRPGGHGSHRASVERASASLFL